MTVKQMQCLLKFLDYYDGEIDGIKGPKMRGAIKDFTYENGLQKTNTKEFELAVLEAVNQDRIKKVIIKKVIIKKEKPWYDVRYFLKKEFACKCGKCGGFPAEPTEKLVRSLEDVRKHFNAPVIITSAVRCKEHNAHVNGVSNSMHLYGRAADFTVKGKTADEIMRYLDRIPHRYFYKIDDYHVHFDI